MNGTEPNIEIFKPFGEAFELMQKILFQPFDIKKWLVIGFAAWLANLGGGGGFNYRYSRREDMQKLNEAISQVPHPILVIGVCVLIGFVLVLIVVCVAASTRALPVYRLHRQESRRHCRTMA